jgi:hypothetical protein
MTVFAQRPIPVASIGGATFNTLIEAVQVANQYPDSTIELLSDASFDTTLLTFVNLTLNMNGFNINRLNTAARWFVGGIEEPEDIGGTVPAVLPRIVINGGRNGTAIKDVDGAAGDISTPLITVQYADITINNVTMINTMINDDASAFCLRDGAIATLNNCYLSGASGIKIFREVGTAISTLTVNDGGHVISECTTDSPWQGSAILAEVFCQYDVNININDAVISSANTAALVLSPKCKTVIKNSTLTGATGVYFKAGSLTIENSRIEGVGGFVEAPLTAKEANTTTTTTPVFDGSGIQIDSDNKFGEPLPVILSSKTIVSSAKGYGIREIGGLQGVGQVQLQIEGASVRGVLGDIVLMNK